jgi:hypothetical protein
LKPVTKTAALRGEAWRFIDRIRQDQKTIETHPTKHSVFREGRRLFEIRGSTQTAPLASQDHCRGLENQQKMSKTKIEPKRQIYTLSRSLQDALIETSIRVMLVELRGF